MYAIPLLLIIFVLVPILTPTLIIYRYAVKELLSQFLKGSFLLKLT
jgi:hypothetical protein